MFFHKATECDKDLAMHNLVKLGYGGLVLGNIIFDCPALKNVDHFKSGQNNHYLV